MKKKYFLKLFFYFFFCTLFFPNILSAQIPGRIQKNSKATIISKPDKLISLSDVDIKKLHVQDSIDLINGLPYRFGKDIDIKIDFISEAKRKIKNDTTILTFSIKCPKAYSINLIFDNLKLSKNSSLSLYSKDRKFKYGPITDFNLNDAPQFWTDIIPGDQLVIELTTKDDIEKNEINISKVIYGYKKFETPNLFGDSDISNIDVNCPEGQEWKFESSSVSLMLLANGTRWCSSSLINNTSQDYKGYILSAFHCIDLDRNRILDENEMAAVNNWMFRFNYESPTCNGVDDPNFISFNGASYKAGYDPTDFMLLELFNTPKIEDGIAYAGWSRSSNNPTSGTGIHHPKGDVKKISFDFNNLTTNSSSINWVGGSMSPPNSHWVVKYDQGTTEGGSSGSPIFDQNRHIVGQLHGGNAYYGRFDKSWNGGGTADTRLKDWLDPNNTFQLTVDSQLPIQISGSDTFCYNNTTTLSTNSVVGYQYNWSVSTNLQILSGQNTNSIVVGYTSSSTGLNTVTLTMSNGNHTQTVYKNLYPIPAPDITNFRFTGNNPGNPMTGEPLEAEVDPVPDAYFYEWYSDSNYLETTTEPFISTYDWECGDHRLYVRASTPCGYTDLNGPDNYYWGMCLYAYSYSPNPASSEIIIENSTIKEKRGQASILQTPSENKIKILVYDFNGRMVKTEVFNSSVTSHCLDVSDLKVGHYFMKIYNGIREETHQIIISR